MDFETNQDSENLSPRKSSSGVCNLIIKCAAPLLFILVVVFYIWIMVFSLSHVKSQHVEKPENAAKGLKYFMAGFFFFTVACIFVQECIKSKILKNPDEGRIALRDFSPMLTNSEIVIGNYHNIPGMFRDDRHMQVVTINDQLDWRFQSTTNDLYCLI